MAQETVWQKSSFSGGRDHTDCVELAVRQSLVLFRESDEPAAVVTTTANGIAALIRHLSDAGVGVRGRDAGVGARRTRGAGFFP